MAHAAGAMGQYLGVAAAGYGEVEPDGETVSIHHGYSLGLSIVQRLLAMMMGDQRALSSAPGKGSMFSVTASFELPMPPGGT
jgi:signal transduction histidine kinase